MSVRYTGVRAGGLAGAPCFPSFIFGRRCASETPGSITPGLDWTGQSGIEDRPYCTTLAPSTHLPLYLTLALTELLILTLNLTLDLRHFTGRHCPIINSITLALKS